MSKLEKPSVLVVGSINMDLVLETSRMPYVGESLIGCRYSYAPGGKGANQAVALARLGASVTLVGRIGRDQNGRALATGLRREGVDIGFLGEDAESQTGLAVVLLGGDAKNSILVFPGANMRLTSVDLDRVFEARKYDAMVLQLEVPGEIVIESCRRARQGGIPIVLDAGPAQDFPLEQIPGVDILTPNETEAFALTGIELKSTAEAERAAAKLLSRSRAKAVVIKLGEAGALLQRAGGKCLQFPPQRVAAVDPTAAGDAFTAAMALRYLETGDLEGAVEYGNFAGALATTKIGAQCALPTACEIEAFRSASPSAIPQCAMGTYV
jgi:ribokinase